MPALRDVQQQLCAAIFGLPNHPAPNFVTSNRLTANQCINIYRGSIFTNLHIALRSIYPVVCRLVGEEFFDFSVEHFIRETPSVSGNIHHFGSEFPEFLRRFQPASSLIYLPDVANLEWQLHELYYAAEALPLDMTAIAAVPEDLHGDLRFFLTPACRLLASPYPVDRIWQSNQPAVAEPAEISLSAGAVWLLIRRRHGVAEIQPLDAGGYSLLIHILNGDRLSTALAAVLAIQPEFDVVSFLSRHIQQGTLAQFYIA